MFCSSGLLKELTGTSLQSTKFVSAGMLVGVTQKSIINRARCFYNEKYA